jgi:hypothetical protein
MIRFLLGLLFPAMSGTLKQRHQATERKLVLSEERLQLAKSIAHIGTWAIDDLTTGRATMSNGLRAPWSPSAGSPPSPASSSAPPP